MPACATRVETVYDAILHRIGAGEWSHGHRLSEIGLSSLTGVSRTPVREALNRLVSEGAVERRPGLGCYVRTPSRDEIAELYDLRVLLEGYAAEQAARHLSPADVQRLQDLLHTMQQLTEDAREANEGSLVAEAHAKWVEADGGFHQLILKAAHCPHTQATVTRLRLITRVSTLWLHGSATPAALVARMELACRWHGRILRMLKQQNDKKAGKAMRSHIRSGKQHVLQLLA